jgi:histidinol phosphatase-like enzyme
MYPIAAEIGVPAYVFYATQKDKYRKPGPGMWEHFVKHVAGGSANIDMVRTQCWLNFVTHER